MNLFEKNQEVLEAFEKERKEQDKKYKDYCSTSRLNLFLENKRAFLQSYVFKRRKETKALIKGKLNHKFLYSIIKSKNKDIVEIPKFGDKRKTETKLKMLGFVEKNRDKSILDPEEYGMFIAIKAFFNTNKKFKEALTIAVDKKFQGIEKLLTSEEPKLKCYTDIIFPLGIIDAKTTFKSDWLEENRGDKFFKYEEKKKAIQAIINLHCFEAKFNKEGEFYWLLICNDLPFGLKLVTMEVPYLQDIKKLVFSKYLPAYNDFVDKVKQKLGYDFFNREKYKGEEIDDWTNLNSLLGVEGVEEVAPSSYATQIAELELGYHQ